MLGSAFGWDDIAKDLLKPLMIAALDKGGAPRAHYRINEATLVQAKLEKSFAMGNLEDLPVDDARLSSLLASRGAECKTGNCMRLVLKGHRERTQGKHAVAKELGDEADTIPFATSRKVHGSQTIQC